MASLALNPKINELIGKIEYIHEYFLQTNNLLEDELKTLQIECKKLAENKKSEQSATLLAILGQTYAMLDDVDNMEFYFKQSLDIAQDDPYIYFNYACSLISFNKLQEAIDNFILSANSVKVTNNILIEVVNRLLGFICIEEAQCFLNKLKEHHEKALFDKVRSYQELIDFYKKLPNNDREKIKELIHLIYFKGFYKSNCLIEHKYDSYDNTLIYSFHDRFSPLEDIWNKDDLLINELLSFEEHNNIRFPYFTLSYER